MSVTLEEGDIVSPKINYEHCPVVCGQSCKRKFKKNWLYHQFRSGKVLKVHKDGTVDIRTNENNLLLFNLLPEMLEKA